MKLMSVPQEVIYDGIEFQRDAPAKEKQRERERITRG